MLKLIAVVGFLMLTACNSSVFPGLMSVPHLYKKGDVQLAANHAVFQTLSGQHAQLAYAITDDWGVLGSAGSFSSFSQQNGAKNDRLAYYELGVLRLLGPSVDNPLSTTYSLQLGVAHARSSLFNAKSPGLNFVQNYGYLQANSRHELYDEVAIGFGFRLGASTLSWQGTAPVAYITPGYNDPSMTRAIDQLNYQSVYFIASPIIQVEYLFWKFMLNISVHPSYIFNQAYPELPPTPLNIGLRWNLKG